MADWSFEQRRSALATADSLARIAANAPDVESKRSVYRVVNFVRQCFGFSDQEKVSAAVALIALGAGTVDDLVAETGFPRSEISKILAELEAQKLVRVHSFSDGRPGPPRKLIVLVE